VGTLNRLMPEPNEQVEAGAAPPTVLLVDDEESFHHVLGPYLAGYRLINAYNGWQALDALSKRHIDVVLLDLNLPDTTGIQLLEQIRNERDDVEVIIVTAHSKIKNAVETVKKGAFDFVAKSFENYQHIHTYVERALEHRRWRRDQQDAKTRHQWMRDAFLLLEQSENRELRNIIALLRKVADTPLTVLIEGESGVGKEIIAQYVHAHSSRAGGPFRAVNLSAVPQALIESHLFGHVKGAFTGADHTQVGKFESAEGGTLFLDEIGELAPSAQVKLLRVLQEREIERLGAAEPTPVDVRVLAATNKDLQKEVAEGRFREDLFFRLNVVRVGMPPLRERWRDIPQLAKMLAAKHALRMQREPPTYSRDAMEILVNYDWPGNVRELENLIMRLVAMHPGKAINGDDIPPEYCLPTLNRLAGKMLEHGAKAKGKETRLYFLAREQFERYLVRLMINRCGGNKKAAARALGVSYSTVKEKSRDYDDDAEG
jgi:DNA-binding NtrC family response regulator